jgi:hypothetical protein
MYPHKGKPEKCPNCGIQYWDKPEDERNLFFAQEKLDDPNYSREEALMAIYEPLLQYSRNMILSKIKNKFIMQSEVLEEKIIDLANKFLEMYLKKEDFRVHSSFGGLLDRISNGILYSKKADEQVESLNHHILDNQSELQDNLESIGYKNILHQTEHDVEEEYFQKERSVTNELQYIVELSANKIHELGTAKESILFLIAMKHFLSQKRDSFMREYFLYAGNQVKRDLENSKLFLRRYLREVHFSN